MESSLHALPVPPPSGCLSMSAKSSRQTLWTLVRPPLTTRRLRNFLCDGPQICPRAGAWWRLFLSRAPSRPSPGPQGQTGSHLDTLLALMPSLTQ